MLWPFPDLDSHGIPIEGESTVGPGVLRVLWGGLDPKGWVLRRGLEGRTVKGT
jgi:hypothetical protein